LLSLPKNKDMESIKNRRTIRKYTNQDISSDFLNALLEEASRAATMGNLQLYSVIITRDADMKDRLSPIHFNQPMVKDAPVVLTFCADFRRVTDWCNLRKAHPGYDNFLSFLNAAIDTLLFTQNFCTIAEDKGLGTCFLGTTIYNAGELVEILKLPALVIPLATITVGYPDEYPKQSDRLPLDAFIHEEYYHSYTNESLDKFYSLKESLQENKDFVTVNRVETLAQIYTDIRYKKSDNEFMSESFIKTLKKQGFLS